MLWEAIMGELAELSIFLCRRNVRWMVSDWYVKLMCVCE